MKPLIGIVSKPNIFCDQELFTQQIIYDGVRNAILRNGINNETIEKVNEKIPEKFVKILSRARR